MYRLFRRCTGFLRNEDGPTAVEYAVMLALIIVICFASIRRVGRNSNRTFHATEHAVAGEQQHRLGGS